MAGFPSLFGPHITREGFTAHLLGKSSLKEFDKTGFFVALERWDRGGGGILAPGGTGAPDHSEDAMALSLSLSCPSQVWNRQMCLWNADTSPSTAALPRAAPVVMYRHRLAGIFPPHLLTERRVLTLEHSMRSSAGSFWFSGDNMLRVSSQQMTLHSPNPLTSSCPHLPHSEGKEAGGLGDLLPIGHSDPRLLYTLLQWPSLPWLHYWLCPEA